MGNTDWSELFWLLAVDLMFLVFVITTLLEV